MAKRRQDRQRSAQNAAKPSLQVEHPDVSKSQDPETVSPQRPLVSLCTVTYNRSAFLPLLQQHILAQTYPRNRMEWVLVDDSDDGKPDFQPDQSQGLEIIYKRLDKHLPLGAKRNLSHDLCRGDIIVYLDDDDYYPPTRVAHAVERLLAGDALVAGSTILPILFLPERELWIAGPYGDRHATAGTFAFKRQLLEQTRYDDEKTFAEEKSFLKSYTFPMVQLDAGHTILCMAHDRNTFEKRKLIAAGKNPRFRKANEASTVRLLDQLKELLPRYESLLNLTPDHPKQPLVASPSQDSEATLSVSVTRVSSNPQIQIQRVPLQPEPIQSQRPVIGEVNICIISHPGDIFSLCFLDVARYLRYRLRMIDGVGSVRLSKNRLCRDAVNIVLGAHVGYDAGSARGYQCIYVNLEQLGRAGKPVRPEYIDLLKNSAVIDYDMSNVGVYRERGCEDVALLSFGYAPYLESGRKGGRAVKPLQEREIDLLFYGSMNERRLALLQRLAGHGSEIRVLDNLFGPERDELIQNSKLVLNLAYYEKGTFEQVRAFHCLSLGTPILSILSDSTDNIPLQFRDCVFFLDPDEACSFLESKFKTDGFYSDARSRLQAFRDSQFGDLDAEQSQLQHLLAALAAREDVLATNTYRAINLGCGSRYIPGWINIDVDRSVCPDLVLDFCEEIKFPLLAYSEYLGPVRIEEGSIDRLRVDNVLGHVSGLLPLMTNCLRLLRIGGQIEIVVPYEKSQAAWQDPSHLRAFNERSWIYYAEWCWRLGWFSHRFKLDSLTYLDSYAKGVLPDSSGAFFMRVLMTKERASLKDRNQFRMLRADFGPGLEDLGDLD